MRGGGGGGERFVYKFITDGVKDCQNNSLPFPDNHYAAPAIIT